MIAIPNLSACDRERFWRMVARAGDNDCWPWSGCKKANGYGIFTIGRKRYAAHRVSIKVAGYSMPTNSVVDHVCRNRGCVNPWHLRSVDQRTNVHENSEALAHLNSLKTHCPQGHPYEGKNLILRPSGRRRCRQCEIEYHRRRRRSVHDGPVAKPCARTIPAIKER